MPGTQHFSYFQTGKESVAGTSVAATRPWYNDGTGHIDIDDMLALHAGNRGTRTSLAYASSKGVLVKLGYKADPDMGVAYDELTWMGTQHKGGVTAVGAGADKTWTYAPSQTAANAQETFTIEYGDDTQEFESEYCFVTDWTIGASVDSMTQLSANWVGRQPTKSTKTALAANQAVRIPGDLWKIRFAASQAGIAGASDQANFLLDWEANFQTGLVPRFYQDGNKYFGQTVEAADMMATLTLHVESTALAVSEFYDKKRAQTVDFCQLKALGPSLGGSNYSAQIQLALLYTDVKPLANEDDGVNIYEVTAQTVIDPTWATSMNFVFVNSVATLT